MNNIDFNESFVDVGEDLQRSSCLNSQDAIKNDDVQCNKAEHTAVQNKLRCSRDVKQQLSDILNNSLCYAQCKELDQQNMGTSVLTVAVSDSNSLLIIRNGSIILSHCLPAATPPATHVLIHHEFVPVVNRFIVLLRQDNSLCIMNLDDLKSVTQMSSIESVSSVSRGIEPPRLSITKLSGEVVLWSPVLCSSFPQHPQTQPSPAERRVITALSSRLQASVRQLTALHGCVEHHKLFVARHMSALRHALSSSDTLCSSAAQHKISGGGGGGGQQQCCSVLSVRHKVLYNTELIICATIHNTSRCSVRGLELILSCDPAIRWTCAAYKSVTRQKVKKHKDSVTLEHEEKPSVTVEPLTSSVLRPGKRAFIVARSTLPSFSRCSHAVSVTLQYSPVLTVVGDNTHQFNVQQVACPPVVLNVLELNNNRVNIDTTPPKAGVSLDSVCLIAGAECHSLTLRSAVQDSITVAQVVSRLRSQHNIVTVNDLTNVYAFPSGLLHYCALHMHQESATALKINIHSKDLQQAMLAAHVLQSALPGQSGYLSPAAEGGTSSTTGSVNSRAILIALRQCVVVLYDQLTSSNREIKRAKTEKGVSVLADHTLNDEEVESLRDEYRKTRTTIDGARAGHAVPTEHFHDLHSAFKTQLKAVEDMCASYYYQL